MTTNKKRIPEKLKNDAIVEAIVEIRFETSTLPEIFYGRLLECEAWKGFKQIRMPAYDLPPSLRQSDPNLRYQPIFELQAPDKNRMLKVGANVVSFHRLEPYEGWNTYRNELDEVVNGLFNRTDNINITRIGLRYINAIRPELHGISSLTEFDMKMSIENEDFSGGVNLNYINKHTEDLLSTVRVATTEFIQGNIPKGTFALVDVDVYTPEAYKTSDSQQVKHWLESAHTEEKEQFFRLLTQETIDALEEK